MIQPKAARELRSKVLRTKLIEWQKLEFSMFNHQ